VPAGTKLPAEVAAQPARALYAGEGGAALVRRLLADAPARLRAGGRVLAEIDPAIAVEMTTLATDTFAGHRIHRDAGGHARVLELWS
jgi:methylase of polypeptide subunit release factors